MRQRPDMGATVRLLDAIGFGLILERQTGIRFSNQTGGTSCLHPELEGVYIPLRNDLLLDGGGLLSPEVDLYRYFSGPPHHRCGATRGLDTRDADVIDGVLRKWRLDDFIHVDRARLTDSHEAWVRVIVPGEEPGDPQWRIFRGLGPCPARGVITWRNTD